MVGRRPNNPLPRGGQAITKRDVASSQLALAIRLWANEWDPIAVHVLASASAEIIAALTKAKGFVPIRSAMIDSMEAEYRERMTYMIAEAFNFMKHGSRDPDAVLNFNPGESEWVIYAACVDYLAAFGVAPPEALLFLTWMTDQRPELIRPDVDDPFRSIREQERIKSRGRKIDRRDVAKTLARLDRFAAHLRKTGRTDYPLLKQAERPA